MSCGMFKLWIGFILIGAAFAGSEPKKDDYSAPYNELPCLLSGGICLVTEECPDGLLSDISGLCPMQQGTDVECCYGLPKSETRCSMRGGECWSRNETSCPEILTFHDATDCKADETCCILVY